MSCSIQPNDPSTGEQFDGHHGIRDYVERFFEGYHTVSRLLSLEPLPNGRTRARVDFRDDFGHEVGQLDIALDEAGMIVRIDADLE
ncbi:nuclear transport factor 2 family protein [Rhizobium sp. P38BS-XIX]|nr:nuclear transport factor 2 family protein [Rhizobium sp. P38BS-XIX]